MNDPLSRAGVSVMVPLTERRCSNCACYFSVPNPNNALESQGFCRREPANTAQMAVEVPMLDAKGQPMMMKDKTGAMVPRMERKAQLAYVFDLTTSTSVCFDGWRPLGTQPGDDWRAHWFAKTIAGVLAEYVGDPDDFKPGELLDLMKAWAKGPAITDPLAPANDRKC